MSDIADTKAWLPRNRDALVTGAITSLVASFGFWIIPGASEVFSVLIPAVKGSNALQVVLISIVVLLVGVGAGALAFAFGRSSADPTRLQIPPRTTPLPPAPAPAALPAPPQSPPWPEFDRTALIADCRILVIDDSSDDKIAMFQRRGFSITLRQQVEHDPSKPYQTEFDLILLDLRGVRSDFGATKGTEALPLLKQDNPWIPVVIFTSYPQDLRGDARDEVERLSAAIIRKSLRYDEIESIVINILQTTRSRSHFAELLAGVAVVNADELLDRAQTGGVERVEPRFSDGSPTASHREAANRIVEAAQRVLATARRRNNAPSSSGT